MPSKALDVNIASSRVDVTIDLQYAVLQEVMGKYHGVLKGLQTFLKEICHPYRNWEFIVKEARGYALNYFDLIISHPKGAEAAKIYEDIFFQALESGQKQPMRVDAADNLLLFIQKIVTDSGADLPRFLPVLDYGFARIESYPKETFSLFASSYYQLNKLGRKYAQAAPSEYNCEVLNRLLVKYYTHTYDYWLEVEDPLSWFRREEGNILKERELRKVFDGISHDKLSSYRQQLEMITRGEEQGQRAFLTKIVELPGYDQIVAAYAQIPENLRQTGIGEGQAEQWSLIAQLHIMNIEALSSIHEETLRDMNRTLMWLMENQESDVIRKSIEKTTSSLKSGMVKFPGSAMSCVRTIGKGVYRTDDSDLVDFFMDSVVSLGFHTPGIRGVGDDWQVLANSAHLQNIRTWLQLIELNPKWSKKLLSSLIIHLALYGVFIKDTDLFPRDITQLLNSDIDTVYNLVKQLARLFPSYFNDIGAEGRLREISTRVDEVCQRKDPLIHFLRKQSHVESNNRIIGLMEGTLTFWHTKNKESVKAFVPPGIYEQIEPESPFTDGVHRVVSTLLTATRTGEVRDLLAIEKDDVATLERTMAGTSPFDFERVELAIELYALLVQKYDLGFTEMNSYLNSLQGSDLPDIDELRHALGEKDAETKLARLLLYLERLKEMISTRKEYPIREDIYRKRHFAVDIPSMYGSYHEVKFDALGLTLRLESLVNVLFEEIIDRIDLKLITKVSISQIHAYLRLFEQALKLDGIASLELARQMDLLTHSLEIRGFSSTQYIDIFQGFSQAVSNIVNDYFNNLHEENLLKVMEHVQIDALLSKYIPGEPALEADKLTHRVTEIFLRDRIASSLGLQQLDLFVSRILNTLHHQSDQLPKEKLRLLLSYDLQKTVTPIACPKRGVDDIIHLGNKGLNLVKMMAYGLPVPHGFIVTTEAFRCREILDEYHPAKSTFEEQVRRQLAALERVTKRTFGDLGNPLLLSVRSGAPISLPGMMVTFLNVGITEEIVQGLAVHTSNPWFAWDTYRRFLQSYGMASGLARDDFDAIITDFKQRLGVAYKKDFTGPQMREIALTYKTIIQDRGVGVEEEPLEQLYLAIRRVLDSWSASKARTYREIMGISDDWGTAGTVQVMVFGNYSHHSGAGVFFTHNPRWTGDMIVPWGDFTLGNQGEDVVSGLVRTMPISRRQAEIENRDIETALEVQFPSLYQTLRQWAKHLIYEKKWSPQEIEFTFEGPDSRDLYLLQTRDMVIRKRKKSYSFDMGLGGPHKPIGYGIGVSGGALSGRLVFTLEEIGHWRRDEPTTPLIMVRNDTVPDDIKELYEADGLLTSRGGSTSHAAIVAHRLGKTCVVGCTTLVCMEKEKICYFDKTAIKSGDWLSMDGRKGAVYLGQMRIREMEDD